MSQNPLKRILSELTVDPKSPVPERVQKAILVAKRLQLRGSELQTPQERRQQREFERMMESPSDKATLTQMTDQAFRSQKAERAADQLTHILDVQGVPRFFSTMDRTLLKGFQSFGSYLPGVAVPLVKEKMRDETANVILPAESELLSKHLEMRRQSGLRMNVNYLGEALLGEREAQRRFESYLSALQLPEIEVISVKVSTIYSQILPIARRRAVKVLCDRLELLYRAAAKERFKRADGSEVPKFVYLDMEEYRDLGVTVEAFLKTLERPGLEKVNAGIALQAYIPDSYRYELQILEWARKRVAEGGAPVTMRIVKGANMEAERFESSVAGWPLAPYNDKLDTDANYRRMLIEGLKPENKGAARLGVASHNLFEVAHALVLASEFDALESIQFEMLEGMANHQRRALTELASNMLLYAPATRREDFINGIGYLIRRLDENTGPDNFLRHAFRLEVDSEAWKRLEKQFIESFSRLETLSSAPKRIQDRREPPKPLASQGLLATKDFANEPDTDFALEHNVFWAEQIIADWKPRFGDRATDIALVIAGKEIREGRQMKECYDPSRPVLPGSSTDKRTHEVVGRYRQATAEDVDLALECAATDPSGWRKLSEAERGKILSNVAQELRKSRATLMGAALANGGKILTESDPEVSEAIDFVEYYAATARDFRALSTVLAEPLGVVVVVPPWNFPIAIPCGGVSAALAAGNTVILKPASDTVLIAWELCQCFWRAGVPREALQFVPCSGAVGGARLVASPKVGAVILTGGTSTALRMLETTPHMNLLAETGGKNATVVTAMSDRDLAIKHVLHSAFSHTGQKCSATSLLILEAEVYDDLGFRKTLVDAIESLKVGSAWEIDTRIGPMIHTPDGDLERGLKELEHGESWALMARQHNDNPNLYAPAVKWDVRPGSYTHMTEFFGPVLAVLRAENLEHAIKLVNQTGYGLTSGLESLDEREQKLWKDSIKAGNLYINRVTTGAIVLRQPFGGMGKSAFGPGIKAGGPNYVAELMSFRDKAATKPAPDAPVSSPEVEAVRKALRQELGSKQPKLAPSEIEKILLAIASYDKSQREEFGKAHDDVKIVGQDNFRRYLPCGGVRVRVHADDTAFDIFARALAARTVGCRVTVSTPKGLESPSVKLLDELTETWGASIEFVEESDSELAEVVRRSGTDRVRYAGDRAPRALLEAVGETGIFVARSPVLIEGRIELLSYVKEQSVSHDYHRYGNLGVRAEEERRAVIGG